MSCDRMILLEVKLSFCNININSVQMLMLMLLRLHVLQTHSILIQASISAVVTLIKMVNGLNSIHKVEMMFTN